MVKIAVAPENHLSQNDPRWASIDLDGKAGGRTIGQWGCLGVAYNILARHWGLTSMLPHQFLKEMQSKGVQAGDYVAVGALIAMFPQGVTYHGYTSRANPRMREKLREYLDEGIPVIGRVDFRPNTALLDQHWVLVIGENNNDELLAIDPWSGQEINVNHAYGIAGSDVLEILLYRPTMSHTNLHIRTTEPSITDVLQLLQHAMELLEEIHATKS